MVEQEIQTEDLSVVLKRYDVSKKNSKKVAKFIDMALQILPMEFAQWRTHQDAELFVENDYLVRLMVSKKYNIKKCIGAYKRFIKFRVEEEPGTISKETLDICEKYSKVFWHGHDKKNNPCLVIKLKFYKFPVSKLHLGGIYARHVFEKGR